MEPHPKEIRKLNALRGLAAVIVLITHFCDVTGWLSDSLGGRAGQYGVMLFFMLSGFLMSYLYFDKRCDTQSTLLYIRSRAGRVLPLYLVVVLLSFGMLSFGLTEIYHIPNVATLLSHLLFIFGDNILWTIAPEIHFYLLFIGLWLFHSWRPAYVYLIVAATLITLFFLNFPRPHGNTFGAPYDFHIFRSLPYFLTGMVMGMTYKTAKIPAYLKSHWYLAALCLIPLMYPYFSPITSSARMKMWLNYEVLFVMATVFFAIVYLVPDNNALLSNKIGDFLGKISYSLYLLHYPIIQQLNKMELIPEYKLVLFVFCSVMVATLSYTFIEKPAARVIRGGKTQ